MMRSVLESKPTFGRSPELALQAAFSRDSERFPLLSIAREDTLVTSVRTDSDAELQYGDTYNGILYPALVTQALHYIQRSQQPLYITTDCTKTEMLGRVIDQYRAIFAATEGLFNKREIRQRLLEKITLGRDLGELERQGIPRERIVLLTPYDVIHPGYRDELLALEQRLVATLLAKD